jgi:excisionase family DNA binding protein
MLHHLGEALPKTGEMSFIDQQTGVNVSMDQATTRPLGLSTSQAAQALGVSLGTIRRWSDMGYLASYRTPGGQRRFSAQQIDEFIESLQRGDIRTRDQGQNRAAQAS